MKTLLLLRHAKSDWGDPALRDADRPLAPRGVKAAPRIARYLAAHGPVPDHVICSAARRAQETWELIAPHLAPTPSVEFTRALYMARPADMLGLVHAAPPDAACVMLVGHNPGMEMLAAQLAGPASDPDALAMLRHKYPTAALAVVDFDAEAWTDVGAPGALRAFVRPRDLV